MLSGMGTGEVSTGTDKCRLILGSQGSGSLGSRGSVIMGSQGTGFWVAGTQAHWAAGPSQCRAVVRTMSWAAERLKVGRSPVSF